MKHPSTGTLTLRVAVAACLLAALPLTALVPPVDSALHEKTYWHPDLHLSGLTTPAGDLDVGSSRAAAAMAGLAELGGHPGTARFDERAGRWSTVLLTAPMLPGPGVGNTLTWDDLGFAGRPGNEVLKQATWSRLRGYLERNRATLGVELEEFGQHRVAVHGEGRLIQVHVPRRINGIPVRDSHLIAAINSGNLVLYGLINWGPAELSTTPTLDVAAAVARTRDHLDEFGFEGYHAKPRLEIVPMAGAKDALSGTRGYDYRLVWAISPRIEGSHGSWEALVDAHSGELLSFEDTNHYQASTRLVMGGILPITNDELSPQGQEQPQFPMPFADVTDALGNRYVTDSAGNLPACVEGDITTHLDSRYVKMIDRCALGGQVAVSSADPVLPDIDLGFTTPGGTDCTPVVFPPTSNSPGNTRASRSGFYEVNRIAEQARGNLPDNTWLKEQLTSIMNIGVDESSSPDSPAICNAFWNGSSINFYRSSGACGNTGEIAGIFDHEWGHGMDHNDVTRTIVRPGEGIADAYMFFRLNTSCVGKNFSAALGCNGPLGGYGDPCINDCDGVRDVNYHNRQSGLPHTTEFGLSACSPEGNPRTPCGGSTHCEGAIYAEAIFDLARRDLRCMDAGGWVDDGPPFDGPVEGGECAGGPPSMDYLTAYELATRLTYQGAGLSTSWFTCVTNGRGGCNADSGYLNYLVADDDNGNLFDGTPHMSAIFASHNRHLIACPDLAVVNSGCAGGPTAAPTVTGTPLDRGALLSWPEVPGAVFYDIFRSEGIFGCDSGKTKLGTVHFSECSAGTCSFVALGLRNGFEYFFNVLPLGASSGSANTCAGGMSACETVIPADGANLAIDTNADLNILMSGLTGDGDQFLDNCEEAELTFDIFNTGNQALTGVEVVSVSSPSNPHIAITTALPVTVGTGSLAPCESGSVTIDFTAYGIAFDDAVEFAVEVTANELPAGGNQQAVMRFAHLGQSDFQLQSSTVDLETDDFAPYQIFGTFNQTTAAPPGAAVGAGYGRSSAFVDGACDELRTPLIKLTGTSTLSLFNQYQIEDPSATPYDRANVGIIDFATGLRAEAIPSSGREYDVAPGSPNGACSTEGQAGWAGTSAGFGTAGGWEQASFDNASLVAAGPPIGDPVQLSIVYGTDGGLALEGFFVDEIVLTDFELQVRDTQICPVNIGPTAQDDTASTAKNMAQAIDVLANDDDPEGDPLEITFVQNPTALGGVAAVNTNGTPETGDDFVDYTPPPGFSSGPLDTFTYEISDGAQVDTALVSVTVLANIPPTAVNDFAVTELNTPILVNVLANDFDANADPLTISDVTSPTTQGGTAAITGGVITYTPPAGFTSPPVDSFVYEISDGNDTATAVVGIGVAASCPLSPGDPLVEDFESGAPGWTVDTAVSGTSTVTWGAITDAAAQSPPTSFFTDDPNADTAGKDDRLVSPSVLLSGTSELRFWHRFNTEAGWDGGVLEVSVNNGAWVDITSAASVTSGGYNDSLDGGRAAWGGGTTTTPADAMTEVVVDLGALGGNHARFRWRFIADSLNIIPALGWWVDEVTITDLLEQDNCAPVANDDSASTDPDTPVHVAVLLNDFDPNAGDTLTIMAVQSPTDQGGVASLDDNSTPGDPADDTIEYTPAAGFSGASDTFTYTIEDSGALSAGATVTVDVSGDVLGFCETLALPPIFDDNFNGGDDPPGWSVVKDPLDHLMVVAPGLDGTAAALQVFMDHEPGAGREEREHFVLDQTPSGIGRYCAEFTFRPNGATLPRRVKIYAARGEDNVRLLRAMVRENPLVSRVAEGLSLPYQVRFSAQNDNFKWVNLPWVDIPDAESLISLHWQQGTGSGDGSFRIYVDGVLGEERVSFNNDNRALSVQAIGNMGLFKPGTFGTFNWDQFVSFGEPLF